MTSLSESASVLETFHTHVCSRDVLFTSIHPGQETSEWILASAIISQVQNPMVGVGESRWALGIYPITSHGTHLIDLMGTEWLIYWDECAGVVTFERRRPAVDAVQHCLMITKRAEFLKFVAACANLRMLLYTGLTVV